MSRAHRTKSLRDPTAIVAPNLRMRESLRRRIEQAAKKNAVSINHEMNVRLQASFDQDGLRTIETIAATLIAQTQGGE